MTSSRPTERERPRRLSPRAEGLVIAFAHLSGFLLGVLAVAYWALLWTIASPSFRGLDIGHYLDATRRWLETGTPYLPAEVQGPFTFSADALTFLHPPFALLLFAPFLVLPIALWWILPIAALAAFVVWCHPRPWAWPAIGLAMAWNQTGIAVLVGNSDLWIAAFIAAGLWFGWPFALVLLKPSLGFFAVGGVRRRTFWIALAALVALALPFGTLWIDWLRVLLNSPGSVTYSLMSAPLMLIPVVAWLGRTKGPPHPVAGMRQEVAFGVDN